MEKVHCTFSIFLTWKIVLMPKYVILGWVILFVFFSCKKEDIIMTPFQATKYSINGEANYQARGLDILPEIRVSFNAPVQLFSSSDAVKLVGDNKIIDIEIVSGDQDSTLIIKPLQGLEYLTQYDFIIDNRLESKNGQKIESIVESQFTTRLDSTHKFPTIPDQVLLDSVQRKTFTYFWDFAHPASGMIRERNTSGDLVTSGGSGFGIMSIIVGIERNFITRQAGLERIIKISDFLKNKADRFHGVFPHWMNGITGETIPFSTRDNGGDLVETSYLILGLLCASEYFDRNDPQELALKVTINEIWEQVEWNWYTKGTENVLFWHWSPTFHWDLNLRIQGWNESLITYILAAASPTFPISKEVYDIGWARNGGMKNGKSFYDIVLPLGHDFGGPLFFSQYTFLGIDPRNLRDQYANYWEQVVNHSAINHAYCTANPKNYYGYSSSCWGLTASDNNTGYSAHSPTNDRGVISPTAALSSMPFTPVESMDALHHFYYILGDKIWKEYGFIDAFNLHNIWFANSYLAIDQGPIIIMIENHRTGLLWNYTMKNKDIQAGLEKLGFTY